MTSVPDGVRREALALFDAVLELDPPEREARLAAAGAGYEAVALVRTWLSADAGDTAALRLERARVGLAQAAVATAAEPAAGERVGPYRLVRELGRGGMGVVWLAERAEGGFAQRVALKLTRPGFGTGATDERFRRERQILAGLEHPHIAHLLDGGVTDAGAAWFALEYVDGEPITRWCDTRALPVEARLQLFLQVCAAVEHAHRHLVVHRDLKPANILVDARGAAKLLDFGIAKVLEQGTGAAETGIMTPEYAAPEQLRGEAVTTATDVHALGLVLFELLTGAHPFRDSGPTPYAVARAIAERHAPAPSSIAPHAAAAAHFGSTPAAHRARLAGDLDAIVARCLEKRPDSRYPSAQALADDVQRHLEHRPIAVRTGRAYRWARFARRHAAAIAAASLVVLALAGGVVTSRSEAARANREAARAQQEADTATAVKDFLLETFRSANPYETGGRTVTAREILETGAAHVDEKLAASPRVRAELHTAFGETFSKLDQTDRAEESYERALALYRETGLGASAEALSLEVGLLSTRYESGKLDGLDAALESVIARLAGASGDYVSALLDAEALLAFTRQTEGRYADAARAATRFIDDALRLRGEGDYATPFAYYTLVLIELDRGRALDAAALLERFVALDRAIVPPGHPGLVTDAQLIARVLEDLGEPALALPIADAARATRLQQLGDAHRLSASALARVASLEAALGRDDDAARDYAAAFTTMRDLVGEDHDDLAAMREHYAAFLARRGDAAAARVHLLGAAAVWRRIGGPAHPRHVACATALDALDDAAAHRARARPRLEAYLRLQRARDDAALPATLATLARWAVLDGNATQAALLEREASEVAVRRRGGPEKKALARRLAATGTELAAGFGTASTP